MARKEGLNGKISISWWPLFVTEHAYQKNHSSSKMGSWNGPKMENLWLPIKGSKFTDGEPHIVPMSMPFNMSSQI